MQNQIINSWQKVKLGEIANFSYGKMPVKGKLKNSGQYPVYSGYRIVDRYDEYNSDEDLIVVARGVGGTGDVKISPAKSFVTNLSIMVKLNKEIVGKEYLFYKYLNTGLRYLDSGSAQSQITISDLQKLEINLPPINVQREIIKILSAFDDKIEVNNKIAKTLEEMTSAIFKDFNKNNNVSKVSTLRKIADVIKGKKPKNIFVKKIDNSKEYLLIESFTGNKQFYANDYKVPQCSEYEPVIVMDGASSGKVFVGKDGFVGSTLAVVKAKQEYSNLKLFILFFIKNIESILISNYTGSAIPHVDRGLLENYSIPVPRNEIIEKFNKLMTPVIKKQEIVRKENKKLAALRDLLLPKLMNGEIRA